MGLRLRVLLTSALTVVCASSLFACGSDQRVSKPESAPAGFSVLAQKAGPDDVVPGQIAEALAQSTRPEFSKADIAAARRVVSDNPVWLIPAVNGELCLARIVYPLVARSHGAPLPPAPAIACDAQTAALDGKLVVTQSLVTTAQGALGPSRVLGVVPDGASAVRVVFGHGQSASVEPIRNGYELVVEDPERLLFRLRTGSKTLAKTVRLLTPTVGASPTRPSGEAF